MPSQELFVACEEFPQNEFSYGFVDNGSLQKCTFVMLNAQKFIFLSGIFTQSVNL